MNRLINSFPWSRIVLTGKAVRLMKLPVHFLLHASREMDLMHFLSKQLAKFIDFDIYAFFEKTVRLAFVQFEIIECIQSQCKVDKEALDAINRSGTATEMD